MLEKFDKSKYSLDKVALLMLFALSLLIGQLIVSQRSKVNLSDLIELDFAGVSVSMPVGGGWEGLDSWHFERKENRFMLFSRLSVSSDLDAMVRWQYLLAGKDSGAGDHIAERVANEEANVVDAGNELVDGETIEWVQVQVSGSAGDNFWGVAVLGYGRVVWLEVAAPGDSDMAENVFRKVVQSLRVKDNSLHDRGVDFVQMVRSEISYRVGNGKSKFGQERIYLLTRGSGETAGFVVEELNSTAMSVGGEFESKSFYYIKRGQGWISDGNIFRGSKDLGTFVWENRYRTERSAKGELTMAELGGDGLMQVIGSGGVVREFWPGRAAVADAVLDMVLMEFLERGQEKVLIDLILGGGVIFPVMLSKQDPGLAQVRGVKVSYSLRMDFLHSKDVYQDVYFNSDKQIVGKYEHGHDELMWYRIDKETLSSKFANWREYTGGLF